MAFTLSKYVLNRGTLNLMPDSTVFQRIILLNSSLPDYANFQYFVSSNPTCDLFAKQIISVICVIDLFVRSITL